MATIKMRRLRANAGSSSTYLCDQFYYPRYNPSVVLLGGRWSNGSSAGVGCRDSHNAVSNSYRAIGARLEFIPQEGVV